jgi:7-keto-8-aminopelargonate synthetase-like enzyme
LITGYSELHRGAEEAIARWKACEDAVLLPSGYQANHAAIQTLAALAEQGGRAVRFLVDKLAHASLIDAVRAAAAAGAQMRVFPHNHLAKLKRLLKDAPAGELQVVVTESIFSMDGDSADLRGLVALKEQRPFVLLLDEAHASGVYGPSGSGYAAELGINDQVDVSVVTLSKSLGGVGGAVCASRDFCAALVNHGRAYMFSTGVPAFVCAGAISALEILRDQPNRQARVRELARRVRSAVAEMGYAIAAGDSPIIPVIFGSEASALAASAEMLKRGFLVPAVRPPTVPKGSSRLRVTLCCDHSDEEVRRLLGVLRDLR